MRDAYGVPLAFMLMNSFATSADTLEYLSKYKTLKSDGLELEFQQNKVHRSSFLDCWCRIHYRNIGTYPF